MRLQTSTMLAIFAVLELAGSGGRSVGAIATKFGVSSHHLAKVMNELARAGLVEAVRGAGGGYQLIANPRRTTLYGIVRLFEPAEADEPDGAAPPERHALAQVLREIDEIAAATLASITIATMCKLVDTSRTRAKRERLIA